MQEPLQLVGDLPTFKLPEMTRRSDELFQRKLNVDRRTSSCFWQLNVWQVTDKLKRIGHSLKLKPVQFVDELPKRGVARALNLIRVTTN